MVIWFIGMQSEYIGFKKNLELLGDMIKYVISYRIADVYV